MLQAYQSAVDEAAIVSITNPDGRIIYVNDKFVEISKYTYKELVGQNHRIINSGYHEDDFFKQMWQTIKAGKVWRGEIKNKAKDGTFYWVDTVITPVRDKNGSIVQFLSIRNVITIQKEHEEKLLSFQQALLKRKQQLKDAQQVSKTGSWYLEVPGNVIEWSQETYRIFEIPPNTTITYELFLGSIHIQDRPMVEACWQAAFDSKHYDIEHRIVTAAGEKWVREQARFEPGALPGNFKALGTVQDITEKKRIEEVLRESEKQYRSLFNDSPFAIGILDEKTLQFIEVNETATKLYGYERKEFLQLTAYDIRVDLPAHSLKKQIEDGNYTSDRSIRLHKKKNGDIIHIEPSITSINYNNKPAFLITINDITEKLRIQQELEEVKTNKEKEILRATLESQEKSRAELGRELHDNINQLLVASTIFLKHALLFTDNDKTLIAKSLDITVSAMDEIRKLSSSFVPPLFKVETLSGAIEQLTKNFKLTNTDISFDININEASLDEGFKVNIYRIIQEQCNNILKHAHASKASISLAQFSDLIQLQITDNGKGFDTVQKGSGIGLSNIIHRTDAYNGKIDIASSIGNGCTITIAFLQPSYLSGNF
ncbi:PAS domain S-box protein [Ferruginibacter sp. SUN106]|uniref:sensor histidine kinase n=1 Tax=Ferruginibacter sp. SUN106 TaxID=2978348 RepID=UPI003D35CBDD